MNLLTSPLIPLTGPQADLGARMASLPELFSAWSMGADVSLTNMRAHQQPAVEILLAQLAAHALEAAGLPLQPLDAGRWHQLLHDLSVGQGAVGFWDVSSEDFSHAAFMQPALANVSLAKKRVERAADLDVLVTSKNHDVKQDDMAQPHVWHWLCALITTQTTTGYTGATLYGVMRMNSGSGTRTFAAGYNHDTFQGRWAQDVSRLLRYWDRVHRDNHLGYRRDGIRLLAALPWDGQTAATLDQLHAGVVEVCRPLRLVAQDAELSALVGGTASPRISAKLLRGAVADPFTTHAMDKDGLKALSPGDTGLTWSQFMKLIFSEDWSLLSEFARDVDTSREVTQRLRAVSRSGTETNGFQDFSFTFPAKVARNLFGPAIVPSERQRLLRLQDAAAQVAAKLVSRAEWGYCKAHSKLDASNDDVARVAKAKHHEKVLATMRSEMAQQWRDALLPWLCASELSELSEAQALEQWFAQCRALVERHLQERLAPRFGAVRTTALGLAKGLNALPSTLASLGT